jgi:ClpP class serine protease
MSATHGKPLIVFVDELAASAAYAISCAGDEIYMTESAIAGSIGVISLLFDQVEADAAMGLNFVTLTSGARKSDGHPHVAVSEDAIAAEQRRLDKSAKAFFRMVSKARGIPRDVVEGFQANIFQGTDAVSRGLADGIMSFHDLLATLNDPMAKPKALGKVGQNVSTSKQSRETTMSLAALTNLIRKATAEVAAEKNPKRRKVLSAALASYETARAEYKKVTKRVEESSSESESEEESEEEAEEESEESEESEAKGNETDRKAGGDPPGKDDDGDDDDDEDEEDEEDEESEASSSAARALASLASTATGRKGKRAVGALAALIERGRQASAVVAQIQKERATEKKAHLIATALNERRIAKHQAKVLSAKPLAFVTDYLSMCKGAIVNIDDDSVRIPDPTAKVSSENLPPEVMAAINTAVTCAPPGADKAKLRSEMVAAHTARMNAASNGAGRY